MDWFEIVYIFDSLLLLEVTINIVLKTEACPGGFYCLYLSLLKLLSDRYGNVFVSC